MTVPSQQPRWDIFEAAILLEAVLNVDGIVISFVFIIGKSIWSCIAVHTLHDFCSFISIDGSSQMNVILGVIQFVILLCYAIYLSKQLPYDNQDV